MTLDLSSLDQLTYRPVLLSGIPDDPKYVEVLVITAQFTHGDADADSQHEIVIRPEDFPYLKYAFGLLHLYERWNTHEKGTIWHVNKQLCETELVPPIGMEWLNGPCLPSENSEVTNQPHWAQWSSELAFMDKIWEMIPWDHTVLDYDILRRPSLDAWTCQWYDGRGRSYPATINGFAPSDPLSDRVVKL